MADKNSATKINPRKRKSRFDGHNVMIPNISIPPPPPPAEPKSQNILSNDFADDDSNVSVPNIDELLGFITNDDVQKNVNSSINYTLRNGGVFHGIVVKFLLLPIMFTFSCPVNMKIHKYQSKIVQIESEDRKNLTKIFSKLGIVDPIENFFIRNFNYIVKKAFGENYNGGPNISCELTIKIEGIKSKDEINWAPLWKAEYAVFQ